MKNIIATIAAIMFLVWATAEPSRADDTSLNNWREADASARAFVLRLARRAFDTYATRRAVIEPPRQLPALLRNRVGIFVSTMRRSPSGLAPRCCMGTLYPVEPNAAREIIANAVAAAGHDRRFSPVKPAELKSLILIVSIVGRPRPIATSELASLDPARDGLVVKSGRNYGIVLSGETSSAERMLKWGRIRAGARATDTVELFRIDVVRFVEKH